MNATKVLCFAALAMIICGPLAAQEAAPVCSGDTENCLAAYQQAARVSTGTVKTDALEELAFLHSEKGEPAKAADYWAQACAANPQDAFARLMRGWALLSLGKPAQAAPEFETALLLTVMRNIANDASVGLGMAAFMRGDYRKALDVFQGVYTRDPYSIALTAYLAAESLYKMNRLPSALTFVQQSLSHDRQDIAAQLLQAKIHEKLDNPIQAWQAYAPLRELDPLDDYVSGRMERLAKNFKTDSANYLYYTRLAFPMPRAPRWTPSPEIRVGLYSGANGKPALLASVELLSNSSFTVTDAQSGAAAVYKPGRRWVAAWNAARGAVDIKDGSGNLEYSALRPAALKFSPDGAGLLLKNAKTAAPAALDTGDREIRGALALVPAEGGFYLVNALPVEDFLPGALAFAKEAATPPEALRALAVILRTKAAAATASGSGGDYDICDSRLCVPYRGINMESPETAAAADSTRGEILVSTPSGAVFAADFHAACGGLTLSGVKDTATPLPALTRAEIARKILAIPSPDLLCAPADPTEWSSIKWAVFLDAAPLERRLSANGKFGRLKSIEITKRDEAGRVLSARFLGTAREERVEGSGEVIRILSGGALRSPLFAITPFYSGSKISRLLVRGLGAGVGAGLCLHGAQALAETGADYKTLLRRYFPQASLSEWKK
ncbi:MAG: SpoIID/LytB domain-containing protein [Elusimicrobiales bacterium]|nr:SpoIID/LytB domain-containing protein [Elusimicrobiales bacterium]